jgi:flagellar export protein FliJ
MAFHFSLEAVLRLRRGQERAERLNLEAIIFEQAKMRAQLEDLTQTHFELRRRFQRDLGGGLVGSELQYEAMREAGVTSLLVSLRARLEQLDRQRRAQAQVFTEARRRREVLENLRLRKLDLYRMEQRRRDQQEIDDLFLMRQGSRSDE